MKVLILGGTRFVGRHVVEAMLAHGHAVTLFHRGQHGDDLFPDVEKLRGDRDGDLGALRGRRWDTVVDTSGYVPRIVRQSAELLSGAVDRYIFVSTISVYSDLSKPGIDENGPVATLDDQSIEEVNGETYGALKVLCEQTVEAAFPGRALILRPGLVAGPHDPTDRFTYWPHRVAQGGEVLAPGHPHRTVQFIDARDLADWTVLMSERRGVGVYNVQGPEQPLGFGQMLDTCDTTSGANARFIWVPDDFLLGKDVEPWIGLPLWIPERDDTAGFYALDSSKAIAQGLRFRTIEETVRDVLVWDRTRDADRTWQAGLTREREVELIGGYRAHSAHVP